ncbi:manganese efflux pump [Alicyclobacillus sp. SO9]|uniref:manganese efflux pump MntP n=1 Tax=Alicyclobacillus sp. SO9 TaxID=2665646 RepID=UPI0018E8F051|nr:manganese efflux pump [Alicyclobacillus sp. SO9]QQE77768.1 manganese efflux pump [Alicyclobacillus sp. SO9]
MAAVKVIVLILSLGMDTLLMSIGVGVVQAKGKLKIAVTFACAEAFMPLFGLLIGQAAGQIIGAWAAIVGGFALLALAGWVIFFEDDAHQEKLEHSLAGWTLVLTALSISVDELAVGFSIGIIGVPVALTIALIALQALLFTFVGITVGAKLRPFFGEWSEKLTGVVLALLGLWILIDAVIHVVRR